MLGKSRLLEALRHFLSHQTVNLIFQLNVVQAFIKEILLRVRQIESNLPCHKRS
jgi:hypothetical protein